MLFLSKKKKMEKLIKLFFQTFEKCSDEDIQSFPLAAIALIDLHILRYDNTDLWQRKLMLNELKHLPKSKAFYKQSVAIFARDLTKMSRCALNVLGLALMITDFRWLEGSKKDGFSTHIHFGYDKRYGEHSPAINQVGKFTLVRDTLYFPVKNQIMSQKIRFIEVPLDNNKYIHIR